MCLKFAFKLYIILGCTLLTLPPIIADKKYNVSLAQMATCQEYDIRSGSGYTYRDFFHIPTLTNVKQRDGERMHLKFYVLTSMDAHILLSVNSHPRNNDRIYEIVIGAGGNTFSTIRTSLGRRRVATNQDPQLLSVFDPTPIEIVQMKDGNLLVYIPGFKEQPLMNFTDASALNINYISFSSFGITSARWFYDCQFDGFDSEIETEVRELTPQQRLMVNITAKNIDKTMPMNLRYVNFAFQIRSVSLNEDASILQTRMHLILYWQDETLRWNPEDFGGIDTLVKSYLDIWTPKLMVTNGALETFSQFNPNYELRIQSNGSVTWLASNAEINTWCLNRNGNWPHEVADCEVLLGVMQELDTVQEGGNILLIHDASAPLSKEPINTLSEWRFKQISVRAIESTALARFTDSGIVQSLSGDVAIGFRIVRNGSFYQNVFTMPLLACESLIILSFMLRGYRRGALLLVVVIVICLGMMFITRHAPPAYVPDILSAYQHILRVVTFCYVLHVAIMWMQLYPPKSKPAPCIMEVVNWSPLRFVLCRRFADADDYLKIQEHPWQDIAKICNNFSFIVINITLLVIDVVLLPKS